MIKLIANKPWILIIMGFLLLIGVWVFFFAIALHNQPERIPLSQTTLDNAAQNHTARIAPEVSAHHSSFPIHNASFASWT